ncbi:MULTISPECIES: hypothetical protein [Aeribacillus]|jgi:hypothetical protein|uniref:YfhE-like protein n=1 Tax=Aeribacillus composti TaxID=1868734 RepID=A0ABY9WHK7_9BACI|nr:MULTISPECIES: hypothetical protein [Aeribacillus]MDR9794806.1 hypothetical protein [Aeribacillus pallidus]MDR9794940.1 hypothetical protein [Aeribacillus pallidus]MED0703961.1 hypothetical protein [Aeribacillus composti]MED1439595.1 hypothetical protein [Aeribacillus composti]MED1443154.1 hypothetical protein [Aeribacillus composti]
MKWFKNKKRTHEQTELERRTDVHDLYEPSREAYGQAYNVEDGTKNKK